MRFVNYMYIYTCRGNGVQTEQYFRRRAMGSVCVCGNMHGKCRREVYRGLPKGSWARGSFSSGEHALSSSRVVSSDLGR
jgi:hypothetical protein